MQYTEILKVVKNEKIQENFFDIFLTSCVPRTVQHAASYLPMQYSENFLVVKMRKFSLENY